MKTVFENIFTGDHKYTVGMIFIFGNLAGFFLNMRKIKVSDNHTVAILLVMMLIARLVV
jgi:hypothetical protein